MLEKGTDLGSIFQLDIRYKMFVKSICSSSLKCAKCQIFGTFSIPNIKTKFYQMFQISKIMPHCYNTVSNMRRYGQQWQNGILLFYYVFLSPLPQISLSPSTLSHFFSLCHSLSLPSPPCLRKLLPISPSHFPVLAADLTNPCRWSRYLILHSLPLISPPHASVLVDFVGFGFVIVFWFGLRLWVVSQVASMGWFRWFGLRLWVVAGSWIACEIGFWFGLRFWIELQWFMADEANFLFLFFYTK